MTQNGVKKTVEHIRAIGDEARKRFVNRERQVELLEIGAVAGEHILFYGPTGTAKSSLVRFFAGSLGLTFFRRVLNPDTTREDLVGPIDPTALAEGRWERAWAGLATCDVALLDELGKASSQVSNMLLDAIEERRVTSGNVDREIPLHMAVAASNETLEDELAAVHDRFLLRDHVGYVERATDFVELLTATADTDPMAGDIAREDLEAARARIDEMAATPSEDVVAMVLKMRLELDTVTEHPVSDRRWRQLLVAAAARALLDGRDEIECGDLAVARDILWIDILDREAVQRWVEGVVDSELAELREKVVLVEDLEDTLGRLTARKKGDSLEDWSRVVYRAQALLNQAADYKRPEWVDLRARLERVRDVAIERGK